MAKHSIEFELLIYWLLVQYLNILSCCKLENWTCWPSFLWIMKFCSLLCEFWKFAYSLSILGNNILPKIIAFLSYWFPHFIKKLCFFSRNFQHILSYYCISKELKYHIFPIDRKQDRKYLSQNFRNFYWTGH